MTSTQTKAPTRNGILMTGLTLLAMALAITLTTACGSSWGEGGDPAEIVAGFAFELELYDVDVYMEQDIPDDLRDSFEDTRAEFERYSIDFADVNNLAKALVDCCAYSNVTQLQGSRVYIVDGTFETDSVRSALEEELYESGTSSGYEIWENRALTKSFMLLDRVAVGFIPNSGYLVIGDTDGGQGSPAHAERCRLVGRRQCNAAGTKSHRRCVARDRASRRPDVQHGQHPLRARHQIHAILPGHGIPHLLRRRHPDDRDSQPVRE